MIAGKGVTVWHSLIAHIAKKPSVSGTERLLDALSAHDHDYVTRSHDAPTLSLQVVDNETRMNSPCLCESAECQGKSVAVSGTSSVRPLSEGSPAAAHVRPALRT